MKTIVFLGSSSSGSSMDALTAADMLGYKVFLITNRKSFLQWPQETIKIIYMESMHFENIQNKIIHFFQSGHDIRSIISFTDPYVSTAAKLSNRFCGSKISTNALELMEDKLKTRLALQKNKAACNFEAISAADSKTLSTNYPFILKEPSSNGSKDVFYIETNNQFENTVRKLTKQNPECQLLIEEFIVGPQYVVEIVVVNSVPIIVAVIRQEIEQEYTFIVTAYDVGTEMDTVMYQSLSETVISIISKIGLHHGTCHIEMRYSSDGWKLIELNPRICGGAMNRMIKEAYGINLVMETLKLNIGEEPDLIRKKERSVHCSYITIRSTGYLLEIEGIEQAATWPGVVDVHIKPSIGATMMPPLTMGHRYGYVMAVGDTTEEARERAENAVRLIKFYIEPL